MIERSGDPTENIDPMTPRGRRILHLRSLQMKSRYCRPQHGRLEEPEGFSEDYGPFQTFGGASPGNSLLI